METDEQGNFKVNIDDLNILDKDTSVFNAPYFFLRLNEEIKRTVRYELFFSLMLIELKDRSSLIEKLNQEDLEFIIEEMGYCIKDAIRGDIDLAGHIEKGLFAIILPETDINGSYKLAQRIKKQLKKGLSRLDPEGEKELSVQIGIIEVPEDGKNSQMVIKTARRSLRKSSRSGAGGIGLIKEIERYTLKKGKIPEEKPEKKEETQERKAGDYYLPFMSILSQENSRETEKPDAADVKILKELEKQGILCSIEFEGDGYVRKHINAFTAVTLLNQKRFVFVEDPALRTAIPCVTPHFDLEIREKVLNENIYPAGSMVYSYEELKSLNGFSCLTPENTEYALSAEERALLVMLNSFKGKESINGKWIVDPNSPFDSLYMMVRRRFLFKAEKSAGIYYHGLLKDSDREALNPVYPNCRLASFEALRLIKRNIAIELITEGGFSHIINNPVELGTFYQVEAG